MTVMRFEPFPVTGVVKGSSRNAFRNLPWLANVVGSATALVNFSTTNDVSITFPLSAGLSLDDWEKNVRGLPVVGIAVAIFFLVLGGILIGLTRTLPWVSVLLILTGIGVPLALFPGKMAALYPYAVELEEGRGLRFYSALGDVYLPIEQVKVGILRPLREERTWDQIAEPLPSDGPP
jgi:hypothetical protein